MGATALFCSVAGIFLVKKVAFKKGKAPRFMKGSVVSNEAPGKEVPDSRHPYLLGQRFHSFSELRKSVVVVGSPGSGKTIQLVLLLRTIISQIRKPGTKARAVVYDSKSDLTSRIFAMGLPTEKIRILNPLDRRGWAWDMAKDIRSSTQAADLASILIPVPKETKEPYFVETAQKFLRGLIEVFQAHAPDTWEFRDVILSGQTTERMALLFASHPPTCDLLDDFEPERTFKSVKSTLSGKLRALDFAAASWHRAKKEGRSLSLRDWLDEQSLIILGNSLDEKAPLATLNALILTQIGKRVLSRPGDRTEENFFILDEFRELGRIDFMSDWAGLGRSKNSCLCLGFQDVYGLDNVYGKEKAREILGNCANAVILHINSLEPDTQKWAAEVLGQWNYEATQLSEGENFGRNPGSSEGKTYVEKTELLWLPSMFATELPPTSPKNGCRALCRFENTFYKTDIPGEMIFTDRGTHHRIPTPDPKRFPDVDPYPPKDLTLEPWNDEDFERLSIPGLKAVSAIKPAAPDSVRERIAHAISLEENSSGKDPQKNHTPEVDRSIFD